MEFWSYKWSLCEEYLLEIFVQYLKKNGYSGEIFHVVVIKGEILQRYPACKVKIQLSAHVSLVTSLVTLNNLVFQSHFIKTLEYVQRISIKV